MNRQSGPAKEKREARWEIKLSCGFFVASELSCGFLVACVLTFLFSALPLLCAVVL
jgi:hypothetical protein